MSGMNHEEASRSTDPFAWGKVFAEDSYGTSLL